MSEEGFRVEIPVNIKRSGRVKNAHQEPALARPQFSWTRNRAE